MILAGIIVSAAYGVVTIGIYLVKEQTTEFCFAVAIITIVVLMDMKLHNQVERLKEEKLDDKIRERFTRFETALVEDLNSTPLFRDIATDPSTMPDLGGSIGQPGQPSEPGDHAFDSSYYRKLRAESLERELNGPYREVDRYFDRVDLYSGTPTAEYRPPSVHSDDSRRSDDHAEDKSLRGYVSEG